MEKDNSQKQILWVSLVIVIVALISGFYLLNNAIYNEKQGDALPPGYAEPLAQRMQLTGTYVCLPHKDTTGPQTLECALGLQADNGFYYSLDFNLMSQTPPNIATGERISAWGVFTPIERLSTDHWRKYNIVGIFSVTDSFKKL